MNLFFPLDSGLTQNLNELIKAIDKTFPLPGRFRSGLPKDVAELSALFTSRRSERSLSYLGKPNLLSAYLRYFLPWNVYRLCKLLPSLPLELKSGDAILDLGSGPLSFVLALWYSRPELRDLPLEFYCLDQTPSVLEAGKKIFNEVTSSQGTAVYAKWQIKTLRGQLNKNGRIIIQKQKSISPEKICGGKPTALVCAINVYNEIYWELSPADKDGLLNMAEQNVKLLSSLCDKTGCVFIEEPGIPRSGAFVSNLRSCMIKQNFEIISPCPHNESCSFPGNNTSRGKGKAKWCHFSFKTDDAPTALHKLSMAAGIPKERAVMSFLFAKKVFPGISSNLTTLPEASGQAGAQMFIKDKSSLSVRIISDSFPVGTLFGRYACSDQGPVLVTCSRDKIDALDSGSLANVITDTKRDVKSGALMGEVI